MTHDIRRYNKKKLLLIMFIINNWQTGAFHGEQELIMGHWVKPQQGSRIEPLIRGERSSCWKLLAAGTPVWRKRFATSGPTFSTFCHSGLLVLHFPSNRTYALIFLFIAVGNNFKLKFAVGSIIMYQTQVLTITTKISAVQYLYTV